jgi:putative ABC transport system ATP-binding protein
MTELQTRTGAAVRAEHATKVYGTGATAVTALDDVSLEFPAGQFTAIMGPSGSGKSTLLHCLAGLDTLTSGKVFVGDAELGRLTDRQLTLLRRDRIGFVFQAFNLMPTLTARENITLPMTLAGAAPDRDWLAAVIERTGLAGRLGHRPAELSGGQQQRVAVARALASRPRIVCADEPTGNLDSGTGRYIMQLLLDVRRSRTTTLILVTHDPQLAALADVQLVLRDGRAVESPAEARR